MNTETVWLQDLIKYLEILQVSSTCNIQIVSQIWFSISFVSDIMLYE